MATWGELETAEPDLAAIGAERFQRHLMAWMATIRPDGLPRVHAVTPLVASTGRLYLFMEPASPKGHDLRRRSGYALHCHVPDILGTWHGEFLVTGQAQLVEDPEARQVAARAFADAQFGAPPQRYVLFELGIDEARGTAGGDDPSWLRWRSGASPPNRAASDAK